ncbi:hypothetical protein L6452_19466 [Arctium lappa]|uniref:Uncharacterized protein n=1 Tax=Arctium lappa TaxID=4217 RepID=A0ACB9B7X5_ARCLA|nr:hypothetical protein L6452_19466 [Arctium lappa]
MIDEDQGTFRVGTLWSTLKLRKLDSYEPKETYDEIITMLDDSDYKWPEDPDTKTSSSPAPSVWGKTDALDRSSPVALEIGKALIYGHKIDTTQLIFNDLVVKITKNTREKIGNKDLDHDLAEGDLPYF